MEANPDASGVSLAGTNTFLASNTGEAHISARVVSPGGQADSSACTVDIDILDAGTGEFVEEGFTGRCHVNTNDYLPPGRYKYEGYAYYSPTNETAPISWQFEVR
jgi:hypothetical protein